MKRISFVFVFVVCSIVAISQSQYNITFDDTDFIYVETNGAYKGLTHLRILHLTPLSLPKNKTLLDPCIVNAIVQSVTPPVETNTVVPDLGTVAFVNSIGFSVNIVISGSPI